MATGERTQDPARWVAAAAGGFLVWRGAFGRGLARIPTALAGAAILRRALGRASPSRASSRQAGGREAATGRQRTPEVLEVKSPAEVDPGLAPAAPAPTFSNRVDRGPQEPKGQSGPPPEPRDTERSR
jgi:hypothetical protein